MSGNRGDGLGNGTTVAAARINESYVVTGNGTMTARVELDGNWNLSRQNVSGGPGPVTPFWQVQSSVSIGTARDFVCLGTACSPSISGANSGSISNYTLSVTRNFSSSTPLNVSVQFNLFTQLLVGDGLIDFGNTAKFIIETTGSLMATPSDPNFLANPAINDPIGGQVPLPASGWMLLGGLAGLVGARAARRRTARPSV